MEAGCTLAIKIIQTVVGFLFIYQILYSVISLIKKVPTFQAKEMCKYAILISAKNEELVVGNLIHSLLHQDYPSELFKVFVVADNCSDKTAQVSRQAGAIVYERFNENERGKGFALKFLLDQIKTDFGYSAFDGYMVFDADNLVSPNYITEINKVFTNGYKICTSYRNSKNYGANWLSAASGLWFIREARHLNHARMLLNVSCMVSGTGYVVHRDIIERNNGWNFFLLTEDIEFSVDSILKGETIGYCESAVFYDEQPTGFRDSFRQRLRWGKGFYQVIGKTMKDLFKMLFSKRFFTAFDCIITLGPGPLFLFCVISIGILTALKSPSFLTFNISVLTLIIPMIINGYLMFLLLGIVILITEYKKIYCKPLRAFALAFLFPIFLLTYVPISVLVIFVKTKWKPIKHTFNLDDEQLKQQ